MQNEFKSICPRPEIIPYIDGELSVCEEELLEFHLLDCDCCKKELTEQKKLLCAMDFAFEDKSEIELPKDFAKVVAVRAESNVNGLRDKKERKIALYSIAFLSILGLIGFSGKFESVLAFLFKCGELIISIGTFVLHFFSDLIISIASVIKMLSYKYIFNSESASILAFLFVLFSIFALLYAFRKRNLIESDNV
jgi:hypothetical protein